MALRSDSQESGQVFRRPLILIVEDDSAVAGMIQDYLVASGYRTATAVDGRAAVATANAIKPDLIVMDLMLPRLTGGEAARELREDPQTADIPIVGISAVADVSTIAELLPIDAVLPKPFDLDDLGTTIEHLLVPEVDLGGTTAGPA